MTQREVSEKLDPLVNDPDPVSSVGVRSHRRCPSCGVVKAVSEFYRDRSRNTGRTAFCKPCKRAANRARAAVVMDQQQQARGVSER